MSALAREMSLPLASDALFRGLLHSGVLDAEAVHQVRRTAKHTRAVLRLAEDGGWAEMRRIRRALAKALRPLGPLRDAVVARHVARKLMTRVTGKTQVVARALAESPLPCPKQPWWTRRWRALAMVHRDLGRISHSALSSEALEVGLACSVRRVLKRARKAAKQCKDIRRAHAWRKSIVVLREQVQALAPPAKSDLAALYDRLHELTRVLGQVVDCTLFLAYVEASNLPKGQRKEAHKLVELAEQRQQHALRKAQKKWPKTKKLLAVVGKSRR